MNGDEWKRGEKIRTRLFLFYTNMIFNNTKNNKRDSHLGEEANNEAIRLLTEIYTSITILILILSFILRPVGGQFGPIRLV